MSTSVTFNNMLKRYLPYKLLWDEMQKRDYFLSKVNKDNQWKGGALRVPFKYGNASSIKFGGLTAIADITEDKQLVGEVSNYKEMWGSMIFNDRDLHEHGDMQQSFLKILPDMANNFVDNFKEMLSINILNGMHVATVTDVTNAATGVLSVDRPARLTIGQYFQIGAVGDQATSATGDAEGWIKTIDISAKTITLDTQKDLAGGAPDLSGGADAVIVGDKLFVDGAITAANGFTSLRSQLLSSANGGLATQFGETKTDYPYLQAYNYDGSSISAGNILGYIFDAYNETRELGKGMPTDVVMSYKNLAQAMKELEVSSNYSTVAAPRAGTAGGKGPKAQVYNWTEIDVVGVKGKLKLVGVLEMDDDIIHMLDWRTMKLHSNGFVERRVSPEGKHYYEVRNTTGYQYVADHRFYGELVVNQPAYNGIIYGISY